MSSGNDGILYGITHKNSSRHGRDLWGKNQFNSTFPLSLCLYMRDQQIKPVAITYDGDNGFVTNERWQMSDVMGQAEQSPFYKFEGSFVPYDESCFSRNTLDTIDLIVYCQNKPYLPLEVKLTVIPDVSTINKDEREWGSELVIRPVSSAYAMMGVASSILGCPDLKKEIIDVLRTVYNKVSDWDNKETIERNYGHLREGLLCALQVAAQIQKPFLVQPIWKTKGQSFFLCDRCIDVFVWSDVALMMVPVSQTEKNKPRINRAMREVARHTRALYELLTQGDYDYNGIYKGMSLDLQTDKGFTLPGNAARRYMQHDRLQSPRLPSSVLSEIILNEGYLNLRPERRFDAAVKLYMEQLNTS